MTDAQVVLAVILGVVVVAVLADRADPRPPRPRGDLDRTWRRLAARSKTVESEHLRPLEPAVTAINAQFESSSGPCRGSPARPRVVAERRPR